MVRKYWIWPLLGLFCFMGGCAQNGTPATTGTPREASEQQLAELKNRMNDVFAGLEMYAADHAMSYPDSLDALIPKFLDSIPNDPLSEKPISYEKTEAGFMLSATGDYSSSGAAAGYPKMNQDGFFVKTEAGFPQVEGLPEE